MSSLSWDDLVKDAGDVSSFEPLPEGTYDFEVKEAKFKPTKTGKKMYEITAKVVGSGPHANRQVWDNLVVSPDSPGGLRYFFAKMSAMGLTVDYFKSNPSDEAIVAALRGRRFRGVVGFRTYNGEKRNEMQKYLPAAGGSAATPPAPQAAPPAPAPPAPPAPAPAAAAPPAPAPAPPAPAPAPAAPEPAAPAAPAPEPAAQPAEDTGIPTPPPPPASPF